MLGYDSKRPARRAAGAVLAFAVVMLLGGCRPSDTVREEGRSMAVFASVPDSSWAELAHKRIWFGHQSVGDNLMDGVADVLREKPALGLNVVKGDSAADGAPAFAHERIGRNGDPAGKTDAFAAKIEGGIGARAEIAFHKYCFVDLIAGSDVDRIFAHYRTTMTKLHHEYPNVTFVHVTCPLVTPRGSALRMLAHGLLGRTPVRIQGNLDRQRFNELMRSTYLGHEPVFDLAAEESTRPDGRRVTIAWGSRRGFALDPEYSDDGSHLNVAGRRRMAEAMLAFLAQLPVASGTVAAAR
jgi:hypothetical protein